MGEGEVAGLNPHRWIIPLDGGVLYILGSRTNHHQNHHHHHHAAISASRVRISCSSRSATFLKSSNVCTFAIILSNSSITAGVGRGIRSGTPMWDRMAAIFSVCRADLAMRGLERRSDAKVMPEGSLSAATMTPKRGCSVGCCASRIGVSVVVGVSWCEVAVSRRTGGRRCCVLR